MESLERRLEWLLEEALHSRRIRGALVVGPNGGVLAHQGFSRSELPASFGPEAVRLVKEAVAALPGTEEEAAPKAPGEAVSFTGFLMPEGERLPPRYTLISLGAEGKLIFRPIEAQGKTFTLVLAMGRLPANTDAMMEGFARAVGVCLGTDWSSAAGDIKSLLRT